MSKELGLKLLELFGIDPKHVTDITINAHAGEVPYVTIIKVIPDSVGLCDVLNTYELVEKSHAIESRGF
jgi:hypothetical protein